jgi:hypothetical protein
VEEAQRAVERLTTEKRAIADLANPPSGAANALGMQIGASANQLDRYRAALVGTTLSHRADADEPWQFTVLDRRATLPSSSEVSDALFSAIATTVGCYPVLLLLMGAFSWRLSGAFEAEELGFTVLGTIPGHSASLSATEKEAEDING